MLVAMLAAVMLWRVERVVREYLQVRRETTTRELVLRERAQTLEETRAEGTEEMPPLPIDLQVRVHAETEGWAREQVRAIVQQLWNKHKAWDPVRSELANIDAASLMQDMGWSQSSVWS